MTGKRAAEIFIIGTAITLIIVAALIEDKHPALAVLFLFWSPFPCPTGLPC